MSQALQPPLNHSASGLSTNSRASNQKVGLKQHLVTNNNGMMPEIGNKKSSGRSAMSGAHASSINSTGKNALKHNRGSVRKDN